MRVVFDSNIFVSAFALPGGRAKEATLQLIDKDIELVISRAIIHEVVGVLARKFDLDAEEVARTALYLADLGELVNPRRRLAVFEDDLDNRILECAVARYAEMVVTGDRAMLKLGEYEGIRILSLKDFLGMEGVA